MPLESLYTGTLRDAPLAIASAIVMVTHDPHAARFASKIRHLEKGDLLPEGQAPADWTLPAAGSRGAPAGGSSPAGASQLARFAKFTRSLTCRSGTQSR